MSRTLLAVAQLVAVSFVMDLDSARADDRPAASPNAVPRVVKSLRLGPAIDAPFRKGLESRVPIEFVDVPLQEVADFLADAGDLPIVIDRAALRDEGMRLDPPVAHRAADTPIETVLDRVLPPLGLTWIVKDESIVVTSRAAADESKNLQRVVYDVRAVLAALDSVKRTPDVVVSERVYPVPPADGCLFGCEDASAAKDDLVEAIVRTTGRPETWEDNGGPASVVVANELLIVRASQRVQREVDGLLATIATIVAGGSHAPVERTRETAADERARAALDTEVAVQFVDVPLRDAAEFLADVAKVEITLDRDGLEEDGIPLDEPVNLQLKASLRSVLSQILEPLDLTTIVRHGAIVLTSEVVSEEFEFLETVVCDVRADRVAGADEELVADMFLRMIGRPISWADQGGGGDVVTLPGGLLVVRQGQQNVRQLENLLAELRAARQEQAGKRRPADDELLLLDYTLTGVDTNQVQDLVETFVSPESWRGDEHVIRPVGNQLFVRTTYANHVKIDALLSKLNGLSPEFGGGSFGLDTVVPD